MSKGGILKVEKKRGNPVDISLNSVIIIYFFIPALESVATPQTPLTGSLVRDCFTGSYLVMLVY